MSAPTPREAAEWFNANPALWTANTDAGMAAMAVLLDYARATTPAAGGDHARAANLAASGHMPELWWSRSRGVLRRNDYSPPHSAAGQYQCVGVAGPHVPALPHDAVALAPAAASGDMVARELRGWADDIDNECWSLAALPRVLRERADEFTAAPTLSTAATEDAER